jgi:Elongation factor SelB, winged helix
LRHLAGEQLEGVEQAGGWVFSRAWLEKLRTELHARLDRAPSLDPGIEPPAEPWAAAVIPLLGLERRGAKLYRPGSLPSLGDRSEEAARLEETLARAGARGLEVQDRELAAYLEGQGRIVRLGDGSAVTTRVYEQARRALVAEIAAAEAITLARFRDLLGISRRRAQLLLERFDADGLTRRVGDERRLRRAARTSSARK